MHSRSAGVEPLQSGHEVAVVEDVAVGERGALREAGRARRVLDVDRVVGPQRRRRRAASSSSVTPPAPATSSSQSSSQKKTARSRRRRRRARPARPCRRSRDVLNDGAANSIRQPTGRARRRSSCVRYAGLMLTRIDADLGGGVLEQRPLGVVRAPQPDPVAGLEAERRAGPWRSGSTRSPSSSYVQRTPWWRDTSASTAPWAAIVRARLAPIVSSSSGDVGPPGIGGECHRWVSRSSRALLSSHRPWSRRRGRRSTVNVRHVDTGDAGSATSSTVRYSAVHVVGVDGVARVAAVDELGVRRRRGTGRLPWRCDAARAARRRRRRDELGADAGQRARRRRGGCRR